MGPESVAAFDSLERHRPKLVNAVNSGLIPRTNNGVELVIRRFAQHRLRHGSLHLYLEMESPDTRTSAALAGNRVAGNSCKFSRMVYRLTSSTRDNREAKDRGCSIRGRGLYPCGKAHQPSLL